MAALWNSALFVSVPIQVFLAIMFFTLSASVVFFAVGLAFRVRYKWRRSSFKQLATTTSQSDSEDGVFSTRVNKVVFASDILCGFFFCFFLVSWSGWSFIPWWLTGILIFVFLMVYYGFWISDYWRSLSKSKLSDPLDRNRLRRKVAKQTVRELIPVIFVGIFFFFIAFATYDVCITLEPFGISSAFSRMSYKDPCSTLAPCFVYLTVGNNASTQFIVHFHAGRNYQSPVLLFDTQPHDSQSNLSSVYPYIVNASSYYLSGIIERQRYVYYGTMNNLSPSTDYYFVVGDLDNPLSFSTQRKIRTAPASGAFSYVSGGDMGLSSLTQTMSAIAASNEILFAAVGGDIPYENGMASCYPRYDGWFSLWTKTMITPSGYTIPILTAIGNHEAGNFQQSPSFIGNYRQYFVHEDLNGRDPTTLNTYHSHYIGDMMLLALDTWVLEPPTGNQLTWMTNQLQSAPTNIQFKTAIYHAPLYPSVRDDMDEPSTSCRNAWEPVFNQYRLRLGFENHDHAYKRTFAINNGDIVNSTSNGVTYVGDGSWGVEARPPLKRWYHSVVQQSTFILIINVNSSAIRVQAIDSNKSIIDDFTVQN